jgi:CheY-like chemotaxis protein
VRAYAVVDVDLNKAMGELLVDAEAINLLLVEDNDNVRHMLELALRGLGFTVLAANSGRQAIETFQSKAVDVVLLDVIMPQMDGPETLSNLKKINPEVICYFMTGNAGHYSNEDLLNCGAAAVLQKPFYLEDLRQLMVRPGVGR